MPTADAPLALVATAHRNGSTGPIEDRVFVGSCSVAVLDGASQLEPSERDGGWLADQLGVALMHRLESDDHVDLGEALRDAIASVADRFGLSPGGSPSTTVSVVRWSWTTVDVLVLGDSPVAGRFRDGTVSVVRDDRLSRVGKRGAYNAAVATGGFAAAHREVWRALVEEQRALRNTAAGYWIGEAVPEAALNAVRASWPAHRVEAVLLLTDGAADGVDVYGTPPDWSTAIDTALDPQALLDAVHAIEADDPQGTKWPRAKLHDDKAAARITFL